MAFTPISKDMNIIAALPDEPNTAGYTAAQLKAKFDEGNLAVKNFINVTLLGELASSYGAGNIGIDDITGMTAENIQDALEELNTDIGALPSFPLSVANGGTGSTSAAAALVSLGAASATDLTTLSGTVTSHTGNTSNPHSVTAAQVGASPEGKVKIGSTEYTLQIGTAEQKADGKITFVLES